ncbi:MAG: tetratricopeptide repeat protein [Terracidiphilus sp.]
MDRLLRSSLASTPPKPRNPYNHPVVLTFFRSRFRPADRFAAGAALTLALALTAPVRAQNRAAVQAPNQSAQLTASAESVHSAAGHGRILLVLPFDNHTGQLSLDWMREAAAEVLNSRFASAGFAPLTREDRTYALDHLGLPQGFQPSRASSIKLAETLDADEIVVGSVSMDGQDLVAEAQLVDVPRLRMTEPVSARGKMTDMIAIFDSLAWKLTRELDPGFNVAEQTFIAAGANLRLDAFEQYIRGITDPDQSERLAHLGNAVGLSPDFSPAWMALGREEYSTQQYDKAADAFAKVDRNGPDGLEASFYRGLSLLFSGNYAPAQQAFAAVARVLPLAEVLNNEGVAVSREGQDGSSFFVRAAAADPTTADYHFNLAVSLKRHGNLSGAVSEIEECLKLHPSDSEAQSLLAAWKPPTAGQTAAQPGAANGATPSAAPSPTAAAEANPDPLERIVRTFDAAEFRQAAAVMDEMDAARLAALPAPERAQKLCAEARDYLHRGLLLEAERLYQSAASADANSAQAHAGLAEVRQRSGDAPAARQEANESLKLDPSADAYLVLCRLDLAAGHFTEAGNAAAAALKLEPANHDAEELERRIAGKEGAKKE